MEIGDIVLNLSLSSNGRFGSDPLQPKDKLGRRSSWSSSQLLQEVLVPSAAVAAEEEECESLPARMARSCSLPVIHTAEDAEEEQEKGRKKRKEMQSLRRMEVKRRRMEKQRTMNGATYVRMRRPGSGGRFRRRRKPDLDWSRSRGRGGSSGVSSDSNSQQDKGRKAAAIASLPIRRTHGNDMKSAEQMLRSVLDDMPCVCTKVDGPNGGRVEGFLFRYRKGEGIKIVCICHGRFLSPAEFVEHAGGSGSDVTHPLKHIVVCPPSW